MEQSNAISTTTTSREEVVSTAGMGRPIPYFPQNAPQETAVISTTANEGRTLRRPPPLNLADIPSDDTYEWYSSFFARFYRLLKEAEDSFPLLAQYHRNVADALADTPTPHGPGIWDGFP